MTRHTLTLPVENGGFAVSLDDDQLFTVVDEAFMDPGKIAPATGTDT